MQLNAFNQSLLKFLQNAPTPFHAVKSMQDILNKNGFTEIFENTAWQLKISGKYYVIRDGSSIVAFIKGESNHGFRLIGAHTDSPCLKLKPNPEIVQHNYLQLGVETYGGVLLNPWFDRDLSLAGRIQYVTTDKQIKHSLINFQKPLAIIPSLAIHLDRSANSNKSINPQTDILPIVCSLNHGSNQDFKQILQEHLISSGIIDSQHILAYNLSFYDTQPPKIIGLNNEYIASARLDNLLSCFVGLQALIDQKPCAVTPVLVCNDHEEIGSQSASGAQGPFLKSVLERIYDLNSNDFNSQIAQSLLISSDNAHAIHPNYASRHDNNHQPELNKGVVIKINANHRYATTDETSAIFHWLSNQCRVNHQYFVARTDMSCGSTIGPITAGVLGIKTVDVGIPTLGMHSIRELAGIQDAYELSKIFTLFFKTISLPNK